MREGDSIGAIAEAVKLASTAKAFAFVAAGSVETWGRPCHRGVESSRMRDQLVRVKEIQAAQAALAAIPDDGSVVTWGHSDEGGDSRQVREQLECFCFCCHPRRRLSGDLGRSLRGR